MKDGLHKSFHEIEIDGVKYVQKQEKTFDYLMDVSENEIKIHLKFTKDQEKRKDAKEALKTFFLDIFL